MSSSAGKRRFARIDRLPPYVFNITAELKLAARQRGEDIIDLSMGNPDGATPAHIVVLHGGGEGGRGGGVDYAPDAQARFQARGGELPFAGRHTLDSFSLLQAGQTEYRRWAFESAALDLALRQAGHTLPDQLGRPSQPLRFVVSTRVANVQRWLELYPDLHFKLDSDREWDDA